VDNAVQMMMVIRKWSKKTNTYQYGEGWRKLRWTFLKW
jgi:hypothetical protein